VIRHALDRCRTRVHAALAGRWVEAIWRVALAIAAILAAPSARAQDAHAAGPLTPDARLELAHEAQRLFDEAAALETRDAASARARFSEAASIYRRIADSGVRNGELMLNLGNALVKSGENSRAIAAYLEAERLLPGDARVQDALAHARAAAGSRLGPVTGTGPLDQMASVWSAVSLPTRSWIALAAWLGLWAIVAAGILTGWRRAVPWRSAIAAVALICVVPAGTVGVDLLRSSLDRPGVVISDAVVLRKGNGEGFAPAVAESLPSGAEFMMLEERPGWLRVRLPDGQSGWIRQGDALVCGRSAPASP
jgi:tetratricopeptide (TPR) repeat protein